MPMTHDTTHSVMFHHFHNKDHVPTQGSLSQTEFRNMLIWLSDRYTLLGAHEYVRKFEQGKLESSDICLSFDDALKCQYDVAVPIMKEFDLDAFFFVYSSAFTDSPDFLEIYRYFRTVAFDGIDDFYKEFFEIVEDQYPVLYKEHLVLFDGIDYLSSFPFYSKNDKWFRYLRDQFLVGGQYDEIMKHLMLNKRFDFVQAKHRLWMSEEDLRDIDKQGHLVGLHSYSHPTQMSKLNKEEQKQEFVKNQEHLLRVLGKPTKVMSHPCGNYNKETLEVLTKMGIKVGFRSNMSIKDIRSSLEIPREDHANVLKEMQL